MRNSNAKRGRIEYLSYVRPGTFLNDTIPLIELTYPDPLVAP
jgi:hypothetical protein